MSYYKYSKQDLLDENFPYDGIFRMENGIFLKGYTDTTVLSGDNTFIKNFYEKGKNFDNIYSNIESVEALTTLPFDVVNKQYFDDIFDTLNNNNLTIYKSLVTINPEVFDRINVAYYALSSPNTPLIFTKEIEHTDPFKNDDTWYFLDEIVAGEILPTSENTFKYLCSSRTELISISGNFVDNNLTVLQKFPLNFTQEIQNIAYDEKDEKLQILSDDQIFIYDGLIYKNCDNLVLLDSIKLEDVDTEVLKWTSQIKFVETFGKFNQKYIKGNPNNPKYIKFGNNFRTSIDNGFLFIMDKYSSKVINTINLDNYGISDLITVNIRIFDDLIAVLHKKLNNKESLYITYIDSILANVNTQELFDFSKNSEGYDVKFSQFDSDLIFLANKNEYQIRSIENSAYPLGKISHESFKYLPKFKFGDAYRKFSNPKIKWSSNNMTSNNFNYIHSSNIIINDTSYHIIISTGRFYVIKQKISDFYKFRIPRHLNKSFSNAICSKSSFGLYLNDNIYAILSDLISLHNLSHCKYVFSSKNTHLIEIENLILDTRKFFLNLNEKIHANNLQRIINNILKIQTEMISISES